MCFVSPVKSPSHSSVLAASLRWDSCTAQWRRERLLRCAVVTCDWPDWDRPSDEFPGLACDRTHLSIIFLFCNCFPHSGNSLGRLRANGPQMLHGSSADPIGGAGPIQHSDWLVQTVSPLLIGGPHAGPPDTAGVPVIARQFVGTARRPVLVTV